ncbi:mechanosensitive ion channel family protein [Methylobacillus flagellatus]|uniref:mechanosensitive ion channel family protein n=1 Tax=Methylobacillus flagellatus TaxID=405 RepID=UPI0028538ED5|nr:mechanosensitive ion channel family protein [Methylobacillus flagellatus]MDR5171417.1 mechanosensitive ion channel family protein [Methylobacillus flagellatus]
MQEFLDVTTFIGLSLYQWITLIIIAISAYFILHTLWRIAINKLSKVSAGTEHKFNNTIAEVLGSTQKITLALFALLIALQFLELPERWETRLSHLTFFVIGIQIALWISKSITIWSSVQLLEKDGQVPNPVITSMLSWILKVAIWSIVILAILSNVGVNITAFIASLGVGGVAVALAVQNILSDLFASLAIGLDKPFVIGDFVVFGEVAGSIERIGLKTTHIRSISGEQIVCSNTELLKNIIHNYKRMSQRRVEFKFGVTYDTPATTLAKIPDIVKSAIETSDRTRFDRAHLKGFGTSSLDFEVVYFVDSSDFNLYMDTQQAINLYMINEFKKLDVSFALPTTNLHIRSLESAKTQ